MAKIKPIDTSKPIVGIGSKLDAFGAACDVVGMTDVPFVSQGAELISAGISLATGDYIGAALSVGSMVPLIGKGAEAAKVAHKAKKIADGVSTAQKEAKLLTITARKADDLTDVAKQSGKQSKAATKSTPPQPSKTQAKAATKQPEKEILDNAPHFDSDEWLGLTERNLEGAVFPNNTSVNLRQVINTPTNKIVNPKTNPQYTNYFQSTGKPIELYFGL